MLGKQKRPKLKTKITRPFSTAPVEGYWGLRIRKLIDSFGREAGKTQHIRTPGFGSYGMMAKAFGVDKEKGKYKDEKEGAKMILPTNTLQAREGQMCQSCSRWH